MNGNDYENAESLPVQGINGKLYCLFGIAAHSLSTDSIIALDPNVYLYNNATYSFNSACIATATILEPESLDRWPSKKL